MAGWCDVPVWWGRCVNLRSCGSGDCTTDVALVVVEPVRYCAGADEDDFGDRGRRRCLDRESGAISDVWRGASDGRSWLEEVGRSIAFVGNVRAVTEDGFIA